MTFRSISLVLLCLLLPLCAVEIAARAYWRPVGPNILAWSDVPYHGSVYDNAAFKAERLAKGSSAEWDERGFWTVRDFAGRYLNYSGGVRVTTDQPVVYHHTVYLFGNSTLEAEYLPDTYTIASYLQRYVNAAHFPYRVVNMGVSGNSTAQNWRALQTVSLNSSDIVVFYSGAVELNEVVRPAQARAGQSAQDTLCERLTSRYAIVSLRALCDPVTAVPSALMDSRIYDLSVTEAQTYRDSILASWRYTTVHGATFYAILQPIVWSAPLSRYEIDVVHNPSVTDRGIEQVYLVLWPRLQRATMLDFTHVLDGLRESGREVYFDITHTNDQANAIVARAIYASLFDPF